MSDPSGGRRHRKPAWTIGRRPMQQFHGKYTNPMAGKASPGFEMPPPRMRGPPFYAGVMPPGEPYGMNKPTPVGSESSSLPATSGAPFQLKAQQQSTDADSATNFGDDKKKKLSELKAQIRKTGIGNETDTASQESSHVSATPKVEQDIPSIPPLMSRPPKATRPVETQGRSSVPSASRVHAPIPTHGTKQSSQPDAPMDVNPRSVYKAPENIPPTHSTTIGSHSGAEPGLRQMQESQKLGNKRLAKSTPIANVRGEAAHGSPPPKSHRVLPRDDSAAGKPGTSSEADFDSPLPFDEIIKMKQKAKAKDASEASEEHPAVATTTEKVGVPVAVPKAIRPPESKSIAPAFVKQNMAYIPPKTARIAEGKHTMGIKAGSAPVAQQLAYTATSKFADTSGRAPPTHGTPVQRKPIVKAPPQSTRPAETTSSIAAPQKGIGHGTSSIVKAEQASATSTATTSSGEVCSDMSSLSQSKRSVPVAKAAAVTATTVQPKAPLAPLHEASKATSVAPTPQETQRRELLPPAPKQPATQSDSATKQTSSSTTATPSTVTVTGAAKSAAPTKLPLAKNPLWVKALIAFIDGRPSLNWLKAPMELRGLQEAQLIERIDELINLCEKAGLESYNTLHNSFCFQAPTGVEEELKDGYLDALPDSIFEGSLDFFNSLSVTQPMPQTTAARLLETYCEKGEAMLEDLHEAHQKQFGALFPTTPNQE